MSFIRVRNSATTDPCPGRPCISLCRCPQQLLSLATPWLSIRAAAATWATAHGDWAHAAGLLSCPGAL